MQPGEAASNKRQPLANKDAVRIPSVTLRPGDALEYRVMRLFAHMGYFVRRGIEIYTEQYLNQATDLDVLAVKFLPSFSRITHITECKGGGGKALDRIFWLSGVRHFTNADRATLVRPGAKWDIKDFALRNHVEILDHPALSRLEQKLGIETSYWPGLTDRAFIAQNANDWNASLKGDKESLLLVAFLSGEFQWSRTIPSIRYVIYNMRRFTKLALEKPEQSVWKLLLVEAFSHLCMFFLALASTTISLSDDDVRGLVHKELKYGTMDPRIVQRMMTLARRTAEQALEDNGLSAKRIQGDAFDYPEPSLVEEVLNLHKTFVSSPAHTTSLPQVADYVFGEAYLRGQFGLPWLQDGFTFGRARREIEILSNVCEQLISLGALPGQFVQILARVASTAETNLKTEGTPQNAAGPGVDEAESARANLHSSAGMKKADVSPTLFPERR